MTKIFKPSIILLTIGLAGIYSLLFFTPLVSFHIHDEGCYRYDDGKPVWAMFLLPFLFTIPIFTIYRTDFKTWLSDLFFTTIVIQIAWMSCLGIHEYLIIQLNNESLMENISWQQKKEWIANTHLFSKYMLLVPCTFLPLSLAFNNRSVFVFLVKFILLSVIFFVLASLNVINSDFYSGFYLEYFGLFSYASVIPLVVTFSVIINTLVIWDFKISWNRNKGFYA